MTTELNLDALKDFFSAYFHEDWRSEAETPQGIVDIYSRGTTDRKVKAALVVGLKQYAQSFADEKSLEDSLFMQLGCYYRPSLDGLSAKAWLLSVAERLAAA